MGSCRMRGEKINSWVISVEQIISNFQCIIEIPKKVGVVTS